MAFDFEREYRRRRAGWKGFALFLAASALVVVVGLGLLGYFLL